MDYAGALRGFPSLAESPRLHLHLARRDERLQVQQVVNRLDEAVAARFVQAHVLQEHLLFLVAFQFGDVGFRLGGDDEQFRVLVLDGFAHGIHVAVAVGGRSVIHIAYVEHRFGGQQEQVAGCVLFLFGLECHGARRLTLFQGVFILREHFVFHFCPLVAAHFGYLFHALQAVFHRFQVFQLQLRVNDFLVAHGIHRPIDVHDVRVVEATQHVDDGVRFADVAQELVAQSLALAGTFHQSCDVHDFACGGHDASRMHDFGQPG